MSRQRLATAQMALRVEERRLQGLTEARGRSAEEARRKNHLLMDEEALLREARRLEPSRLAYSFANDVLEEEQGVAEIEASVALLRSEYDQQEEISRALNSEIATTQSRLTVVRANYRAALAAVVNESPELAALADELTKAWGRVRGIRAAFNAITTALAGHLDGRMLSHWQSHPSLEIRAINEPDDPSYIVAWQGALAALANDADAPLPMPTLGKPKLMRPV
jgi:hypothetical protein